MRDELLLLRILTFRNNRPLLLLLSVRAKIPTGRVADSPPAGSERDGVLRYVRKSAWKIARGEIR